jgi:hypothetical protein
MANAFDKILEDSVRRGIVPSKTVDARNWFRSEAQKIGARNSSPGRLINQLNTQSVEGVAPGSMYLFGYDPKHKTKLPYYDRYPLVFPFAGASGGFYGINMHYLPPVLRAKLMDALYSIVSNKKFDSTTVLKLSYQVLNRSSKFKYFKPCVKHYLNRHVRTNFILIDPRQWDIALFLPLQRFAKADAAKVYSDSQEIING